jgi:hypothetical protein
VNAGQEEIPTVNAVTVSPGETTFTKGGTRQFTAGVSGSNNPAQAVTWTVEGGGEGTGISDTGLLTVAANETAASLTVRATSTVDTAKSGTATVTVNSGQGEVPTVSAVTVSPGETTVTCGGTQSFTAGVSGSNNPAQTVTWTVEGGGEGTGISETGLLTVAAGEPAASLTVRATSTVDTAISGKADVTLTGGEPQFPPTGLISVEFTGLPQDETIALRGADVPLSWAANTTLTVSVPGSFTAYRWVLDGVEQDGNNGSSLTLNAGNLTVRRHSLTVFVTKDENGVAVEYAKRVTFLVAQ